VLYHWRERKNSLLFRPAFISISGSQLPDDKDTVIQLSFSKVVEVEPL